MSVDGFVDVQAANKATAVRLIRGFNDDDWDAVRDVVAPGFVFHHPLGGTVEAGPEGMVSTWAGFKALSPDSWHPIPVMIAEGDYVANLLPTYGHFTGSSEHAPPPTGGRLDYGMVNLARLEAGRVVEMWFGMDSLVEMQQMGVAPSPKMPKLGRRAEANLAAFERAAVPPDAGYDCLVAFDEVVVAMGPPQADVDCSRRWVSVYRFDTGEPNRVYGHNFDTNPPYGGDPDADPAASRAVVEAWFDRVLNGRSSSALAGMASPHVLVHPTAMPCEARYYGATGVAHWLDQQRAAFADLHFEDLFLVTEGDLVAVRWAGRGTSTGAFMGQAPNGERIEFTGLSMYRIEEDKVAEIWDTRDTLGILSQLNPQIGGRGHHH